MIATFLLGAVLAAGTNLTGVWTLTTVDGEGQPIKAEMKIDDGQTFKVTLKVRDDAIEVPKARHEGDTIEMTFPYTETEVTMKLTLKNGVLEGNWSVPSGESAPVTAVRAKP